MSHQLIEQLAASSPAKRCPLYALQSFDVSFALERSLADDFRSESRGTAQRKRTIIHSVGCQILLRLFESVSCATPISTRSRVLTIVDSGVQPGTR